MNRYVSVLLVLLAFFSFSMAPNAYADCDDSQSQSGYYGGSGNIFDVIRGWFSDDSDDDCDEAQDADSHAGVVSIDSFNCSNNGETLDCNEINMLKASTLLTLNAACLYDGQVSEDIEYTWGVWKYGDEISWGSADYQDKSKSYNMATVPSEIDFDEGDSSLKVYLYCSHKDSGNTDSKTFEFKIKDNELNLELSLDNTEIGVDDAAVLTAKFSGSVKCEDEDCTETIKKYINNTATTADDSGLELSLESINVAAIGMKTSSKSYTAKFNVIGLEEGEQSISIRVNGNGYDGQYVKESINLDVNDLSVDIDGDGYTTNDDCNDGDANVNPGATEICNGIDDNCDGQIDESVTITFYQDGDEDGFGTSTSSVQACTAPSGFVSDDTDCDDGNAAINPDAEEICNDGIDNDCDSTTGDTTNCTDTTVDADEDGYTVLDDCNDGDASINPGATEVCNSLDDNCDGSTDEGVTNTYYTDSDADGFGVDFIVPIQACEALNGYADNSDDCDDTRFSVNPDAQEICDDDLDNDCDTFIDDSTCVDLVEGSIGDKDGGVNLDQDIDKELDEDKDEDDDGRLVAVDEKNLSTVEASGHIQGTTMFCALNYSAKEDAQKSHAAEFVLALLLLFMLNRIRLRD
jgi:hypothetical protein